MSEGLKATGYVASATDADNDSLTYSISGGDDQSQFVIDSATGALSFIAAPVFDQPADYNKNNIYTIDISVTDSHGGITTQIVQITVTDAPRVLTDLSVENSGALLTATVTCDDCQLSATAFEWFLEGDDAPVAIGNSYKLRAADQLKKVTVKAIPLSSSGAPAKPEKTEVSFNKVENVVFGEGINAALKTNGDAVIWGEGDEGDQDYYELVEDVDRIIEPDVNDHVFAIAAIKKDKSLVTWGDDNYGGGVSNNPSAMNVKDAFSGRFIVAFNEDGSVARFGSGPIVEAPDSISFDDLKNIRKVVTGKTGHSNSASSEFFSIDQDGEVNVFCWWGGGYCWDSPQISLSGVTKLVTSRRSYAALLEDGSLVSQGASMDSSWKSSQDDGGDTPLKLLSHNGEFHDVTSMIVANGYRTGSSENYYAAFAALRENGEVITWGSKRIGGDPDGVDLTNVESLYATTESFAAKKNDGSVTIWRVTGKVVADQVKVLVANKNHYAAIKMDGTLGYWDSYGEDSIEDLYSYEYDDQDNEIVTMPSLSGIKELIAGRYSFTALKDDGSVYVLNFGDENADPGFTNIVKVFQPQVDTYAGLDADGNLRIWGDIYYAGDVPEEDLTPTLIELSSTIN